MSGFLIRKLASWKFCNHWENLAWCRPCPRTRILWSEPCKVSLPRRGNCARCVNKFESFHFISIWCYVDMLVLTLAITLWLLAVALVAGGVSPFWEPWRGKGVVRPFPRQSVFHLGRRGDGGNGVLPAARCEALHYDTTFHTGVLFYWWSWGLSFSLKYFWFRQISSITKVFFQFVNCLWSFHRILFID